MNFKQALAQAAENAESQGKITSTERSTIRQIAEGDSVRRAAAIENVVLHTVGHPHGDHGAIDWVNLVQQIQTLLPLILQLIALFKKP